MPADRQLRHANTPLPTGVELLYEQRTAHHMIGLWFVEYQCISSVEWDGAVCRSRLVVLYDIGLRIAVTCTKRRLVLRGAERSSCRLSVRLTGSSFICVCQENNVALCLKT